MANNDPIINKTRDGVKLPDLGSPESVAGIKLVGFGVGLGVGVGVEVGVGVGLRVAGGVVVGIATVGVAEGVAVNAGSFSAASTTNDLVRARSSPSASVHRIVTWWTPGDSPAGTAKLHRPDLSTSTEPLIVSGDSTMISI
jgi:hypothetical protein